MKSCLLSDLPIGKKAKIISINCNYNIKRRLLDLGIIENSNIIPVFRSPFKDPTAYLIRGTIIALRNEDTQNILVGIDGRMLKSQFLVTIFFTFSYYKIKR